MESANSSEKLVDPEAGFIPQKQMKNFTSVTKSCRKRSMNKFLKYLFITLTAVLLVGACYAAWQTVSSYILIKEIEIQDLQQEKYVLPLFEKDMRIEGMADELRKLQNALKDMQRQIDRQNLITTTTELSTTAISQLKSDDSAQDVDENNSDDRSKTPDFEMKVPFYFSEPEIVEEGIGQDLDKFVSSEPEPIEDTKSGFHWIFEINFGGKSEKDEKNEELNISESKESTEATTEKGFDIASDSEKESSDFMPSILPKILELGWMWGNSNEDDSKDSESSEKVEKKFDSVEIGTEKSPEVTTTSDNGYDDYYDYLEKYYDSYEYPSSSKESSLTTKNDNLGSLEPSLHWTEILMGSILQKPTTESIPTSIVNEDEENVDESTTTESTVPTTSAPKKHESSSEESLSDDYFGLGTLPDNLFKTFGSTPNSEDLEDGSTSIENIPESSSVENDTDYKRINRYFSDLLQKRLSEVNSLDQMYSTATGDDEYLADAYRGYYDDDFEPFGQLPSASNSDEWSYISKRSVDTPSVERRPSEFLSSKELEQKMALIQVQIDDDNHFLQNEVSLASEPTKLVLQRKLDNFYAKMESVSAHIDRLHERYLRLNKLNDDYVSRELPSEGADGTWASNY